MKNNSPQFTECATNLQLSDQLYHSKLFLSESVQSTLKQPLERMVKRESLFNLYGLQYHADHNFQTYEAYREMNENEFTQH